MATFIWPPTAAGGTPTPGDLCECYFETIAEMAASTAPNYSPLMYNFEVDAPYEFVPGDVTPDDGWTSVTSLAGFAGRWLLRSDRVSLGTSAVDQGVRLTSAFAAFAGKAVVNMRGETFPVATPISVPSNLWLTMEATTVFDSSMASSGAGGFSNSVFLALGASAGVATTTAAATVIGSNQISITANNVNVGQYVSFGITANNTFQMAKVLAKSGAGPFVLTLDDEVMYVFASGSEAQAWTPVENVRIEGNYATIRGTGDRAMEFASTQNFWVEKIRVVPDGQTMFTTMGVSYDVGGRDNWWSEIYVNGGRGEGATTPPQVGIALESQVRGGILHSRAHDIGISGADCAIFVASSRGYLVDATDGDASNIGIYLSSSGGTDAGGSGMGVVRGGNFLKNTNYGVLLGDACEGASFVDCRASFNGKTGIHMALGASNTPATAVLLDGVICEKNGTADTSSTSVDSGIHIASAAGVRVINARVKQSIYKGITVLAGDAQIVGFKGLDNAVGDVRIDGAGKVRVVDLQSEVTAAVAGFWIGLSLNGTGDVWLEGASFTGHNTGTKVCIDSEAGSTRYHSRGVRTSGALAIGIALGGNADSPQWWRGPDENYASCGTPISVVGTASKNWGQVTLTAGVGTYPWTGLVAGDVAPTVNRLSTSQGLTGTGWILVAHNPGVGVVITSINVNGATCLTDEGTFEVWAP